MNKHILKAKAQLIKLTNDSSLDVIFVAQEAGDIPMSPGIQMEHERIKKKRGHKFYSDLLFTLTHEYFPHKKAKEMWEEILEHKEAMSFDLGRNVGVSVAALDYLSNLKQIIKRPRIVREAKITTLADVATRDGLTTLYDKSSFFAKLFSEFNCYHRNGSFFSLLMVDIDRFKQINDTHGHQVGDKILRKVSRFIKGFIRDTDVAARYGGEEFAIILGQTEKRKACEVAERLRKAIEIRFKDQYKITVSIGVATCPTDVKSPNQLVKWADLALYHSKQQGRNCTSAVLKSDGLQVYKIESEEEGFNVKSLFSKNLKERLLYKNASRVRKKHKRSTKNIAS